MFNQMGLIEAWGNGLRSIRKAAREYELQEPEFIEMPETFRVNLYRKALSEKMQNKDGKNSEEVRNKFGINSGEGEKSISSDISPTQKKILVLLSAMPDMTGEVLANQIGMTPRTIEINI